MGYKQAVLALGTNANIASCADDVTIFFQLLQSIFIQISCLELRKKTKKFDEK